MLAVVLFAAAKPAGIPAHAIQIAPDTYRFKDKQGQTWIYRQTPFGLTHFGDCEDRSPAVAVQKCVTEPRPQGSGLRAVAPPADAAANIRVTAQGETLEFERPGPFGVYRWQKKESELNQQERAVWLRQSESAAGQD
jgi:hypothetical protein